MVLLLALAGGVPGDVATAQGRPAELLGADALHEDGLTGLGVTVAVVGRGTAAAPGVQRAAAGHDRLLAAFDARAAAGPLEPVAVGETASAEPSGQLSVMLSSLRDPAGRYLGVAPNADLVLVTAFDPFGAGDPADVAAAIDWAVANRDRYGIRVLHLPLAGSARARWWEDPVARAAAGAWRAGIVVVAAAGNSGPAPATIATPGDVPGVITVGASDSGSDGLEIAPYSAAGPTLAGFAKPEILAPAGPVAGPLVVPGPGTVRALAGGTAIAAASVSGVVALLLEASPWLTPDEVKHRLLSAARPLSLPQGPLSVLRQGAGTLDARAAVTDRRDENAAARDAGSGEAWWDSVARGYTWSDSAMRGYTWSDSAMRGYTWSDRATRGFTWLD